MKKRKFKIATWFIEEEFEHKISISYDNETERAYQLLDIISSKLKYDRRRKFNSIEITEEEYQTWYKYFLEYYIDDDSIYYKTEEYKEYFSYRKSKCKKPKVFRNKQTNQ